MEETPRSSTTPSTPVVPGFARDRVEIGEAVLDQRQAAVGLIDQIGTKRDGGLVTVNADHFTIGGRKDRARIAARAKGAIDIDAAVTRLGGNRPPGGRARECGGPVRQRQPSRRRPPSFPCSKRVARRHLGTQLAFERAHLLGGLRELALETAGLPDLKLVTETDKRHRLGNSRMTLEVLAQHHAPSPSIFSVSLVPYSARANCSR